MNLHRKVTKFLVLVQLLSCSSAGAQSALEAAQKYSDAFMRGDCSTMEALTSETVRRSFGSREKLRDFLCDFRSHLQREGMMEWREEFVGSIASFRHDATAFEFIQKRRVSVWTDRTMSTEQPYVVHSSDGGRSWSVLDVGCLGEEWVKRIAPTWRGEPALPASRFVVQKHVDN